MKELTGIKKGGTLGIIAATITPAIIQIDCGPFIDQGIIRKEQ